jgi:hypothetical protein
LKTIFSTSIAILTGLVVLVGYFVQIPILIDLRSLFLDWAVILAAFIVFIGVLNISIVNISHFTAGKKDGFFSLILIISMFVTLVLGLILTPGHPIMNFVFNSIQLPVELSLMAVLSITFIIAAVNLLRRKPGWLSLIFLVTALLILVGTAPSPFGEVPFVGGIIKPFIAQVLAASGARGILLGVGLAALTMGLRILFGADRPYGGS